MTRPAHQPAHPPLAADVTLGDVAEVLMSELKARDAAIANLVAMLGEMRADAAILAARVDLIDPPDHEVPAGYCSLKQAAFASGFTVECIRQWAKAGMGIKRGGAWLVELSAVMERAGRKPG
jgi:hypothetical protein